MDKIYMTLRARSISVAMLFFFCFCSLGIQNAAAQEKVYVSTDKECYLAGESIWCSLYCIDENGEVPYKGGLWSPDNRLNSRFSRLSKMAIVEFYTREGLAGSMKVALVNGRGCARFEIPFSFATGNYSIVAFTKRYGGNSKDAFNGKIVTVFNTLTDKRVDGGVEIVGEEDDITNVAAHENNSGHISVEIPAKPNLEQKSVRLKLHNLGEDPVALNVSVYHNDILTRTVGCYNNAGLLERTGSFETTDEIDYEGEHLLVKITEKDAPQQNGSNRAALYRNVYMSSVGGLEQVYIAATDSLGYANYYTNNMFGKRDLVFDVAGSIKIAKISSGENSDTSYAYNVEIVEPSYKHIYAGIPVLKISPALKKPLEDRSIAMQFAKMFDADTLYDFLPVRENPLLKNITPISYRLDDYTRFPIMEDVIREYVKNLRIRKFENSADFQVRYESDIAGAVMAKGTTLALLDGVPVRDHSLLVNFDPLLIEKIMIYPRQIIIGNFVYDGIVQFNTYKGDMGALKLSRNVSILSYEGVKYPLAFYGGKIAQNSRYPNYNQTIYWNPVVEIGAGESFEFDCVMPNYKGDFRIVVEGIDASGKGIYHTAVFSNLPY